MDNGLEKENQVLRERVAELEKALISGSDPLLRSLSELATEYMSVISPDGQLLAAARPSDGYGSVIGKSVFDFVEAKSAALMRLVYARVVSTGCAELYESVGFGEDGSPGHSYLTRAVPLKEGDRVHAIVLVSTDITDRVRLEESIVEKEETLSFAVKASRLGLWQFDIASGAITWNERLCEIFSLAQAPAGFEEYLSLIDPLDQELVKQQIAEALTSGTYRTFEHRVRPVVAGPVKWILASGTVVKDAEGATLRLVGGVVDITEQKQLDALQQRAARVESLGQLSAGLAHNFNNLLAVILPALELDGEEGCENPARGAALEAALQARDLVRDLTLLTQRDFNNPGVPADPLEVAARVVGICRATFPKDIQLQYTRGSYLGHVTMSAAELSQVLLNLLFNARDALDSSVSDNQQRIVTLSVQIKGDEPGFVELRLRDTGVGMTEDVRARIFEPFFTTKPPHKGSGLGLAYSIDRVRDVGGTLRCESIPGVETTMIIDLPLRVETADTVAVAPFTPKAVPARTILVIDDESLVRRTLKRLLEPDGFTVLEAAHAQGARDLLQSGAHVDLIILDQSMPVESGINAFPSIRALSAAPVVLFTGMAPDLLPSGIAALLEKPARAAEIRQVVMCVLDRAAT